MALLTTALKDWRDVLGKRDCGWSGGLLSRRLRGEENRTTKNEKRGPEDADTLLGHLTPLHADYRRAAANCEGG
jgi:hypothetical protein